MAESSRRLRPPNVPSPARQAELASKVVAQIGGAIGVRSAVEALGTVLRPEEAVVCAAVGFVDGRTCLVLITSGRFLILRGHSVLVDLEHQAISRFRARTGLTTHDLELQNAQGNVLVVKQVHPKAQLEELARVLAGGAQPANS
jgi:hypothetical protein